MDPPRAPDRPPKVVALPRALRWSMDPPTVLREPSKVFAGLGTYGLSAWIHADSMLGDPWICEEPLAVRIHVHVESSALGIHGIVVGMCVGSLWDPC